jgi:hypothetical protein
MTDGAPLVLLAEDDEDVRALAELALAAARPAPTPTPSSTSPCHPPSSPSAFARSPSGRPEDPPHEHD